MLSRLRRNNGSEKTFQYDSLDDPRKDIRILCLRPALLRSAPIKCTLRHCSLDDSVKYDALSYVWGDETPDKPLIYVNNKEFRVLPNLESALRSMRMVLPTYFWIDAICINQHDHTEKEHQILLMKDIYQKADFVTVWLGPTYMDSERAIGLVNTIADRYRKLDDGQIDPDFLEWMISITSSDSPHCAWEPLVALLRRSWWTRLWIIQEVTLAKKVIVLCGALAYSCHMADFFCCYAAVSCCIPHIRRKLLDREAQAIRMFQVIRDPHYYMRLEQALFFLEAALKNGLKRLTLFIDYSPASLLQLVITYRASNAKDPRDKIYGLLGLISDPLHKDVLTFAPKYNVSVHRLYVSFAQHYISEGGLSEILEECQSPPTIKELLKGGVQGIRDEIESPNASEMLDERQNWTYVRGLPSWVPDWTTTRRRTRLSDLTFEGNQYKASGDLKASFLFSAEGGKLHVDAIAVDILERVGPEFISTDTPPFREVAAASLSTLTGREMDRGEIVKRTTVGIEQFYADELEEQYIAGGTTYNAWRRTIHCSQTYCRGREEAFMEDQFQLPTFVPKQRPTTEVGWDLRYSACLNHRRFCVSSLGYTCLVPEAAKVGDSICVILGMDVPFVIRKCGDNNVLVGECYVHGLMEGEAVTKLGSGTFIAESLRLV